MRLVGMMMMLMMLMLMLMLLLLLLLMMMVGGDFQAGPLSRMACASRNVGYPRPLAVGHRVGDLLILGPGTLARRAGIRQGGPRPPGPGRHMRGEGRRRQRRAHGEGGANRREAPREEVKRGRETIKAPRTMVGVVGIV
ncbi:hypothetical protein H696_04960 [Fonticula alba]|uniref:Secreted protein n=1 Tax=Fonticula alba TaxID=691883 RepID=A0A058Z2Z8_FONAL|nr:hypothetical protein H696_04960 [Fonticula alba]KCV68669.1 hypothetical protein H696_04960 [Fonticula alba]|eukprot:XP_009497101.1 hypothetical protein H696_04960 [Fonticula alba]